jgi:aquaporin Z
MDTRLNGILGILFIAFVPFVGVVIGVYLFDRISMAHFIPAVTLRFLITKHITKRQLFLYSIAEITGSLRGSLFVKYAIGTHAILVANSSNYAYPLPSIFGLEVSSSAALLMAILSSLRLANNFIEPVNVRLVKRYKVCYTVYVNVRYNR